MASLLATVSCLCVLLATTLIWVEADFGMEDQLRSVRSSRFRRDADALFEEEPQPAVRSRVKRVVGGDVAQRSAVHFLVALVTTGGTGFCGGSLISSKYIMTAASCLRGIEELFAFVGAFNLSVPDSALQVRMVTNEYFHIHPNFHGSTLQNDIAVVEMIYNVTINDLVETVTLMESDDDLTGQTATICGWGAINDSLALSEEPHAANVTLLDNDVCLYKYGSMVVTNSTICVDGLNTDDEPVSPCLGDVGTPLILQKNGSYVQIGVMSFTAPVACTDGYPMGYTKIASHREWIRNVTGI